ncbi:hypothetical protein F5Y16DRAFT_387596 [Xylariaceae sp. FL0255]|nr:hypothetical protein F5Y16DRAFT_387596 [Xylariaceae sp. FL0255]
MIDTSGVGGVETTITGVNLGLDWAQQLTDMGSSHQTTPLLGCDLSPGNLDDLLPSGDETPFIFNSLSDTTMPSATSTVTTGQPDPFPMSPPSDTYENHQPLSSSTSLQHDTVNSNKRRSPPVDHATALKRQRNNVAARKYRQKRIDRITELEAELAEVKQDRDDLRLRLARQEAETAALRAMLGMKSGETTKK